MPEIPKESMSGGLFFGIDQLLNGGSKMIIAATKNAVTLDLKIKSRYINDLGNQVTNDVYFPINLLRKKLIDLNYEEVGNVGSVQKKGHFYIDEQEKKITISFEENLYPFHIVGVKDDGEFLDIAIDGTSGISGVTLFEAYLLAEELGLKRAGIVDQGNSVRLALELKDRSFALVKANKRDFDRDTRSTSAILYSFPKSKIEPIRMKIKEKELVYLIQGAI